MKEGNYAYDDNDGETWSKEHTITIPIWEYNIICTKMITFYPEN